MGSPPPPIPFPAETQLYLKGTGVLLTMALCVCLQAPFRFLQHVRNTLSSPDTWIPLEGTVAPTMWLENSKSVSERVQIFFKVQQLLGRSGDLYVLKGSSLAARWLFSHGRPTGVREDTDPSVL